MGYKIHELWDKRVEFDSILRETIKDFRYPTKDDLDVNCDALLVLETQRGNIYHFTHIQDCCEDVKLQEISGGELKDLIGKTIVSANTITNHDDPIPDGSFIPESYTWTFYDIGTNDGFVTLRFYGESNGYYSERIDFLRIK